MKATRSRSSTGSHDALAKILRHTLTHLSALMQIRGTIAELKRREERTVTRRVTRSHSCEMWSTKVLFPLRQSASTGSGLFEEKAAQ
jgi:hypothetical protein